MVRTMLDALKMSSEPTYLVQTAMKYLRGLKGNLVQDKKRKKEKELGINQPPKHHDGGGPASLAGTTTVANSSGLTSGIVVGPNGVGSLPATQAGAQSNGPQQGTVEWSQLPIEQRLMALTSQPEGTG